MCTHTVGQVPAGCKVGASICMDEVFQPRASSILGRPLIKQQPCPAELLIGGYFFPGHENPIFLLGSVQQVRSVD